MRYNYKQEKKVNPNNENVVYGVNISDKEAVKKKVREMRIVKAILTLLSLIILAGIGFIVFDFWNVSFNGGRPIVALLSKVDSGIKFQGIGYSYIRCSDGKVHLNEEDDICNPKDDGVTTFDEMLHKVLITYLNENKIIDNNFKDLTINSYSRDSENSQGGYDYYVDVTYSCNDGSDTCFKPFKDKSDKKNIQIYVSLDKTNTVFDVFNFKKSGTHYEELNEEYKEKVKDYLIKNNLYVEENVRYLNVKLLSNKGKCMFRGTTYEDLYEINISYMCNDNGNTCITTFNDGENKNLTFKVNMYLDKNNEIGLIESILAVN